MQRNESKWLDLAIASVTALVVLAPLIARNPRTQAYVKEHVGYWWRQLRFTLRHATDPAWQRELADQPDDNLFSLFATPEPQWYADAVE